MYCDLRLERKGLTRAYPCDIVGMPQAGCMARILGPETRAGAWLYLLSRDQ